LVKYPMPDHGDMSRARPLGVSVPISESPQDSKAHLPTTDERTGPRFAAARVKLVYPGAIGDLISRELIRWEQFGYRIGGKQTIMGLLGAVEDTYRDTPCRGETAG
jgi:hypothetical protein